MTKQTIKPFTDGSLAAELARAIHFGTLADIKRLIKVGAKVSARRKGVFSPLMRAVTRGNPKITAYLIDKGADVNDQNEIGQTALMISAQRGNEEMVRQLLAVGADVRDTDNEKRNAIAWAMTRRDFAEVVSLLIVSGADYNAPDIRGITPLLRAAIMGYARCAGVLLAAGANEKATLHGKTAYEIAKEKGYTDVANTIRVVLRGRPKGHAL